MSSLPPADPAEVQALASTFPTVRVDPAQTFYRIHRMGRDPAFFCGGVDDRRGAFR